MRILMLSDGYPPHASGGLELHVQRLSQQLVQRGHHVAVATLQGDRHETVHFDGNMPIYPLRGAIHAASRLNVRTGRVFAPPAPDPLLIAGLRAIVRREQPDVVHAHSWLVHSFLPLKKWSGARLLMTLHDYGYACANKGLMRHDSPCVGPGPARCLRCAAQHFGALRGIPVALAVQAMRGAQRRTIDVFLPVSRAVASASRLDADHLPYEVLHNFIDDTQTPLRPEDEPLLAQLPREPFLLFVGGLERVKGIQVLFAAYRLVESPPPLVVIGPRLTDLVRDAPPGVQVTTGWSQAAVQEAWRRSLFGVVPSIWPEPCPTVALEAMAAGRALVGSRIGGIPELVDDRVSGILVPANDAPALAKGMRQLLIDPDRRADMGRAGNRRVEHFVASRIVPRIEQIYTSAPMRSTLCSAA